MENFGSQSYGSLLVQITHAQSKRNRNPLFAPGCTQIAHESDLTGTMRIYTLMLSCSEPHTCRPIRALKLVAGKSLEWGWECLENVYLA